MKQVTFKKKNLSIVLCFVVFFVGTAIFAFFYSANKSIGNVDVFNDNFVNSGLGDIAPVVISDNEFVGGSFVFENDNVVVQNCEFENANISLLGQNVQFLDSNVSGGNCSIGGEMAIVDSCEFQDIETSIVISGTVMFTDSNIKNSGIKAHNNAVAILLGETHISGIGVNLYNSGMLLMGYNDKVEEDEIFNKYGIETTGLKQFSGSISACNNAVVLDLFSELYMCSGSIENNSGIGVRASNASGILMHGNGVIQNNGSHGVYLKDDGFYEWHDDYFRYKEYDGYESTFNFRGGLISNNGNAEIDGGGVYIGRNCNFLMEEDAGCFTPSITNNRAQNGGGIYCAEDAKLNSMIGANLTENTATENGGGLYLYSDNTIQMDYSNISKNVAKNGGGIFCPVSRGFYSNHLSGININVSTSFYLTENSASENGGAVYLDQGATLTISGEYVCVENNSSSSYGGAIYANDSSYVTINGGTYVKNHSGAGGVIYSRKGSLRINGGKFGHTSESYANNAYSGGVIFITNGTFSMSAGSMEYNSATNGGAISFGSSNNATISGGKISSNSATCGGGVYIAKANDGEKVTISGSAEISNNKATDGGGIYLTRENGKSAILHVTGGSIISNQATNNGGGIYSNGSLTISGGNIGNVSVTWSGGKYTINSDQGNTAGNYGGGIYAQTSMNLKAGAKIRGNNATDGGGIYVVGTLYTDGGFVDYNEASGYGGGIYATSINSVNTSGNLEVDFNKSNYGAGMTIFGGTIGKNVKIRGNIAKENGGGIHLVGANVTIDGSGGEILIGQENSSGYSFENTAKQGGGIFAGTNNGVGGNITMKNVNIVNNRATDNGGGLTVYKAKKVTFGSGTKILKNYVSVQSGVAFGGGVVIDDCESAVFSAGSEVSNNYILKTGTSLLGNLSYAGGGGVYITGETTQCYLQNNMDNANPAKFHNNYISENFAYSAGGNIYINSNVKKFSMQQVEITGDCSTKQAKIGGGLFIYTPELGEEYGKKYDDPSKINDIKIDIHGGIFDGCVADYGGAIASIGSFKLRSTAIDYDGDGHSETYTQVSFTNCQATIGSAIFTAGMLAIGSGVFMNDTANHKHDIAIASNESGGTYKKDNYSSIFKTTIPYRTGSIYLLTNIYTEYQLNFCDFVVDSITQQITVNPNSMENIESHYFKANQPNDASDGCYSKLLVTGYPSRTYAIQNTFELPKGLYWAMPFKEFENPNIAMCISDKEQIFLDLDNGNLYRFSLDKDSAIIGYDVNLESNTHRGFVFSDNSWDRDYNNTFKYVFFKILKDFKEIYLDGIKISNGFVYGTYYYLSQIIEEKNITGTYLDLDFKYS